MKKGEIPIIVIRDRQSGDWTWEFVANHRKTRGVAPTQALASLFAAIAIRELRKQGVDVVPKRKLRRRLNLKPGTISQPSLPQPALGRAE